MNYCDSEQSIEILLSFIYSLYECVQNFHYDILSKEWINIGSKAGSIYQLLVKSFNNAIPFLLFFLLSSDGMKIKIWTNNETKKGEIIFIPYGSMLLLRGDVIHASGFKVGDNCDQRGHLYIYKYPLGIVCPVNLENWYHTPDGKTCLHDIYVHHDDVRVTSCN